MVALLIDAYDFGKIVVGGKTYTSDVLVFPDRVLDHWWRVEGHNLSAEDLEEVLRAEKRPEVLVVGTGHSGVMRVSSEVEEVLRSVNVELLVQPTAKACKTFNELLRSGRKVAAALHLTC